MTLLLIILAIGAAAGLVAAIGGTMVGNSTTMGVGLLSFVVCSILAIASGV